ncbi:MAG: hypothetical protein F4Y60_04695 [Boseongicola sp. SB0664_bin_43]|uniref:DUF6973 domain-containing protein n=1 Tax=Boseongicola sp. SB0664_bin_43 TaxID=2604844 RepID=A0A6B0XXE5_9RHOB|nr:hypothetical protein [Boseongicola sp. SB0664_bin_43]
MAHEAGETVAIVVTDMHESAGGGPPEENQMDRHNNRVGAAIGSNADSQEEVRSECMEAVHDGRLMTSPSQ